MLNNPILNKYRNVRLMELSLFPLNYNFDAFDVSENNPVKRFIPKLIDFTQYYYSKSGNKVISTFLLSFFATHNGNIVVTDSFIDNIDGQEYYTKTYYFESDAYIRIYNIIGNKFYKKWNDLYDLYAKKYDFDKPFNISFSEESTDTLSSNETSSGNRTVNDSNTSETLNSKENTNTSRYGFNSTDAVNTDKVENTFVDKSKDDYSSEDVNSKTSEYTRTNPKTRDTTRIGNIGNTTIQELVKQEREKLMYQLWDTICVDLDSVLTRSKYIF